MSIKFFVFTHAQYRATRRQIKQIQVKMLSKQIFKKTLTQRSLSTTSFLDNRNVVLVDGARTPFLKSSTDYNDIWQYDLLSKALSGLLRRNPKLDPKQIDHISCGCVIQTVATANVAREAALAAGIPKSVPANTVTLACISANVAINQCVDLIRTGDAEICVAGGVEMMSDTPILWPRESRLWIMRYGQKIKGLFGPKGFLEMKKKFNNGGPFFRKFIGIETSSIADFSTNETMGHSADRLAAAMGVTREEQDNFAYRSHQGALDAQKAGKLTDIIKVWIPGADPNKGPVDKDGAIFPNLKKSQTLKPAFIKPHGTVTAANASFLTDGATACLIMSEEKALELGMKPLAYIRESVVISTDPVDECLLGPAYATSKVLLKANKKVQDIDVFEIHEAFAGQVLANVKAMGDDKFCKENIPNRSEKVGDLPVEKINNWGGSLSIGHPFGATGVRLLTAAALRLQDSQGKLGLVTACAASGHAVGTIVERYPN